MNFLQNRPQIQTISKPISEHPLLLRPAVIYHGIFGSGFFQRLYEPNPVSPLLVCTFLGYHVCLNLPLMLLAFYLDPVRPLALASLGLSLGSCLLAAAQAKLPRSKRRFWSRPLVALLFFLQPLVRGWARFKWRFNLLSGQKPVPIELSPVAKGMEIPDTITYWSDGRVDRYQFLQEILTRLQRAGWTCRLDTGWTSHDVEVLPHLWTRLRLTTVSEELEKGKINFRCRIGSSWSAPARILFTLTAFAVALGLPPLVEAYSPKDWKGLRCSLVCK